MTNGVRFWCEDKATGQVIHLSGEFTWGDCHEVRLIFEDLITRGILPPDGSPSSTRPKRAKLLGMSSSKMSRIAAAIPIGDLLAITAP